MMKRIIILITLFSLLNSCYYIEQAILDEKLARGIKRPKMDNEVWEFKRGDELKKK